jgi:hypothetical protein
MWSIVAFILSSGKHTLQCTDCLDKACSSSENNMRWVLGEAQGSGSTAVSMKCVSRFPKASLGEFDRYTTRNRLEPVVIRYEQVWYGTGATLPSNIYDLNLSFQDQYEQVWYRPYRWCDDSLEHIRIESITTITQKTRRYFPPTCWTDLFPSSPPPNSVEHIACRTTPIISPKANERIVKKMKDTTRFAPSKTLSS